jgi:hypothetical protein
MEDLGYTEQPQDEYPDALEPEEDDDEEEETK